LCPPPTPTLFPYTTLFRSLFNLRCHACIHGLQFLDSSRLTPMELTSAISVKTRSSGRKSLREIGCLIAILGLCTLVGLAALTGTDRKSTRLNSSHVKISYA